MMVEDEISIYNFFFFLAIYVNTLNLMSRMNDSLVAWVAHNSVESVHIVGGVVDSSDIAIGLNKWVLTSHNIAIALLVLVLDVTGECVMNSIFEFVFGIWVGVDTTMFGLFVNGKRSWIRISNCSTKY